LISIFSLSSCSSLGFSYTNGIAYLNDGKREGIKRRLLVLFGVNCPKGNSEKYRDICKEKSRYP